MPLLGSFLAARTETTSFQPLRSVFWKSQTYSPGRKLPVKRMIKPGCALLLESICSHWRWGRSQDVSCSPTQAFAAEWMDAGESIKEQCPQFYHGEMYSWIVQISFLLPYLRSNPCMCLQACSMYFVRNDMVLGVAVTGKMCHIHKPKHKQASLVLEKIRTNHTHLHHGAALWMSLSSWDGLTVWSQMVSTSHRS